MVNKGFRGEILSRTLNLCAIDKAMQEEQDKVGRAHPAVVEVSLSKFLEQFSRPDLTVNAGQLWKTAIGESPRNECDDQVLKRLALWDSFATDLVSEGPSDGEDALSGKRSRLQSVMEAKICFTHFVYLSSFCKDPIITHALLREAYYRTAALIVEEERRGIDWIIPIRLEENKFVGLVGQDKNRMNLILDSLRSSDSATFKLNCEYFLTDTERRTFSDANIDDVHWPSVLFSLDGDKNDVGAAKLYRTRTRSPQPWERYPYPCIILCGLDFVQLLGQDCCQRLKTFRDAELEVSAKLQASIPLTYSVSLATKL
jgi:hypothetical protein